MEQDPTIEETDWKLVQRLPSVGQLGIALPEHVTIADREVDTPVPRENSGVDVGSLSLAPHTVIDTNILSHDLGSLGGENFSMLDIEQLPAPPPNCEHCGAVVYNFHVCLFCGRNGASTRENHHSRIGGRKVIEYDLSGESEPTIAPSDDGVSLFCIDVSGSSESCD